MTLAQQWMQQGVRQGVRQGVQQGIEKGVIMGRQEGMEEGCEKVARNMLLNGYSVETVAKISDLPIHVVQKLKDEILVS